MKDYKRLNEVETKKEKLFNFDNNTDNLLIMKIINYKPYKTLDELFEAYDSGELFRCKIENQNIVSGIVELLKYKYLGQPLIADFVLDEKSKVDKDGKKMFPGVVFSNTGEYCNINRLGFTNDEIKTLKTYFDSLDEKLKENISFYDLLNRFSTSESIDNQESIKEKINIIKSYKKSQLENCTIEKLRESLNILLLRRDSLNKLIENVQDEINLRLKSGDEYGRTR